MLWRDVIDLTAITSSTDNVGDQVEVETKTTVYCNKKSVRQSEFYQAMAIGLKPEFMFQVRIMDYSGQEWLYYDNKKYQIIRTYTKNDEIIELVCKGTVA